MTWVALVLLAALSSVAQAAEVTFRFAPPDGLECDLRSDASAVKDAGIPALRSEDVSRTLTHLRFEKTPDGYRLVATMKSAEITHNGQAVEDPTVKLMIGRPIALELGPDATVKDVKGYEKLWEDAQKTLSPDMQKGLASVLDPAALRERAISDWNGKIARFVGKNVTEGETWEGADELSLSTGMLRFTVLTRFSKIEERDGKTMVTVNFAYDEDAAAAAKVMGRVVDGLLQVAPEAPPDPEKVADVEVQGGGERRLDARTMTVESEKTWRVIRAPMELPKRGEVVVVRTENREYTYRCGR